MLNRHALVDISGNNVKNFPAALASAGMYPVDTLAVIDFTGFEARLGLFAYKKAGDSNAIPGDERPFR